MVHCSVTLFEHFQSFQRTYQSLLFAVQARNDLQRQTFRGVRNFNYSLAVSTIATCFIRTEPNFNLVKFANTVNELNVPQDVTFEHLNSRLCEVCSIECFKKYIKSQCLQFLGWWLANQFMATQQWKVLHFSTQTSLSYLPISLSSLPLNPLYPLNLFLFTETPNTSILILSLGLAQPAHTRLSRLSLTYWAVTYWSVMYVTYVLGCHILGRHVCHICGLSHTGLLCMSLTYWAVTYWAVMYVTYVGCHILGCYVCHLCTGCHILSHHVCHILGPQDQVHHILGCRIPGCRVCCILGLSHNGLLHTGCHMWRKSEKKHVLFNPLSHSLFCCLPSIDHKRCMYVTCRGVRS